MLTEKEKNYYIKKKRALIRQFDAASTIVKDILINKLGEEKYNEIIPKARADFESLIPQIPYIGGKNNRSTDILVSSALVLPFFRALDQEGLTFDEIGEIVYNMFEVFFKVMPQTEDIFSEEYLNKLREGAKISKLRKYPGDWVYDFVEGDDVNFTWGTDFHECGVYKFYKRQGLENYMPIVCVSDFAMAQAYGYGLKRTQNIANGAPFCDFRFVKGGTSPRGWPLKNLPEF
ncbi:MAG: L-2-amino-thiazoline-4-carboxylic acid hydrolase [Candidatus Hermodarchaeota archaeon]